MVVEVVRWTVFADLELAGNGLAVDWSSSEYNSLETEWVGLKLLEFVSSGDGLSVGLETTDITGRHYRLTPVLNTRNATATTADFGTMILLFVLVLLALAL